MAKLENVERIEKEIFRVGGNFTVKNTVVTGQKGQNNVKLHPVYSRSYNSTKYSDRSSLESMNIRTSDFLVFAYNDFQNKINEEIYISYPHMVGFLQVLEQAVNMVNTNDVYTSNGVNPKYADTVLKTPQLGGQKTIVIIPALVQYDQTQQPSPGVMLFLNSDEKFVQIDRNGLNSLWYILKNFNLYSESATLLLTGLVYDGGGVGGGSSFSGGSSSPNTGTTFGGGAGSLPKRGFFGGNNANANANNNNAAGGGKGFTTPTKNTTMKDLDKVIDGDIEMPNDDDVPFSGGEEGGNDSPLSLSNIIGKANEIEVPDLDDDEDGKVNF
jgi:hypothetical protein